jgi:hypothetical protein
MERHEWTTLFDQPNHATAWADIAESKPSLAERHAARIFRNRKGGAPWFLQLFLSLWLFLWLLSRAEVQMNGPLLAVFFFLALNGTFTAWITQGFCELVLRALSRSHLEDPETERVR